MTLLCALVLGAVACGTDPSPSALRCAPAADGCPEGCPSYGGMIIDARALCMRERVLLSCSEASHLPVEACGVLEATGEVVALGTAPLGAVPGLRGCVTATEREIWQRGSSRLCEDDVGIDASDDAP